MFPHIPRAPDELELVFGDFVYVSSDDATSSPDGWAEGVSWLTGWNKVGKPSTRGFVLSTNVTVCYFVIL